MNLELLFQENFGLPEKPLVMHWLCWNLQFHKWIPSWIFSVGLYLLRTIPIAAYPEDIFHEETRILSLILEIPLTSRHSNESWSWLQFHEYRRTFQHEFTFSLTNGFSCPNKGLPTCQLHPSWEFWVCGWHPEEHYCGLHWSITRCFPADPENRQWRLRAGHWSGAEETASPCDRLLDTGRRQGNQERHVLKRGCTCNRQNNEVANS